MKSTHPLMRGPGLKKRIFDLIVIRNSRVSSPYRRCERSRAILCCQLLLVITGAHEASERTQAPLHSNLIAMSSQAEEVREWSYAESSSQDDKGQSQGEHVHEPPEHSSGQSLQTCQCIPPPALACLFRAIKSSWCYPASPR